MGPREWASFTIGNVIWKGLGDLKYTFAHLRPFLSRKTLPIAESGQPKLILICIKLPIIIGEMHPYRGILIHTIGCKINYFGLK